MVVLAAALVITLATTLINLDRRGYLLKGDFFTTSAVSTSTGTSNLSITSSTSITNGLANLDFGSGTVLASCSTCVMSSQSDTPSACCSGFTDLSGAGGFVLENTGNTNISVGYNCAGSCTAATFIGGKPGNKFLLLVRDSISDPVGVSGAGQTGPADVAKSCVGGTTEGAGFNGWLARNNQSNTTGGNGTISVSAIGGWLCGNSTTYPLQADNNMDAGIVHLNITINSSEVGTGTRQNATFTFNATSAG